MTADNELWAIRIRNLTKAFPLDGKKRTAFSTIKRRISKGPAPFVIAIQDMNFEMMRGERIGLVGENGAGKTTLLKIIAGLSQPTAGTVQVNGEISFLAGLGIGMIEDLSVETNVILYGMIYGLDRKEICEKIPEILEWAELTQFIESPVMNLSSGMKSRLAFSISRHFKKDIYILDEALTAGDKKFQEKARMVFESYKNLNRTFLIATHDAEFVKNFCTRAIWIQKGQIRSDGNPEQIVDQYLEVSSK